MLTRLRVRGFKNLVDSEVRFGPFTCIAGPNGVGKSNLFDAIIFLSRLADSSLLEAATGVRGETRSADALRIFSRWGKGRVDQISFDVDLITPREAHDDLDQPAKATATALNYQLEIRAHLGSSSSIPRLEIVRESLTHYKKGDAAKVLPFARGSRAWLNSAFHGSRKSAFISTDTEGARKVVRVHEDSGHQGRARVIRADSLQRTVLSSINTAESPTALIARREMQSWRLLQLEPSRLREPDEMKATGQLQADGAGLAATLNRLLNSGSKGERSARRSRLVNRLRELNEDVRDLTVDADQKRELLTAVVTSSGGVEFRARDLSDGTLRFLALAVLAEDATWSGLLCMEEPENGVHPTRLEAMRRLLADLSVGLGYAVNDDNPLRQVIINTHSPELVGLVPSESLILAGQTPSEDSSEMSPLRLRCLAGTWRARVPDADIAYPGEVIEFLLALRGSLRREEEEGAEDILQRVGLRGDVRQLLLFDDGAPLDRIEQ